MVEGVDFVPERVPCGGPDVARTLLSADGAVILTGWPVRPDSVVNAAAAVLGTRLRVLEKVGEDHGQWRRAGAASGWRQCGRGYPRSAGVPAQR
jgi:hypothetical protein